MIAVKSTKTFQNVHELVEECYAILKSHEVTGTKWSKNYRFYRPALKKYGPYQWLWDSGWHMIVWSHRQPGNAVADLRTLLQFQQQDGFIPEIVFWGENAFIRKLNNLITGYSHEEYTDLTQMPMLAYSVRAIWHATSDLDLLKEFVPKIAKFLEWWECRDHDNDGLLSIIHPWESGIDASPSYDLALKMSNPRSYNIYPRFWRLLRTYRKAGWNQQAILEREWFNFEDVGLCSVYADGWGVLASLANKFDNELADRCLVHHKKYQEAIIRKCWDKENEQFVSFVHQDGEEKVSRTETIQTLLPILLDDLPLYIQQKLVAKIADLEKFWVPYPIPTVARSEIAFNPNESMLLWRGPVWPSTNWLVMEGLLKHGFKAQASAILDLWTKMYLTNGIWEYYNPLTGKGLGQKELGMSTIIMDMLYRFSRV